MNSPPERGAFFIFYFFDFQLGLSPFDWGPAGGCSANKIVLKSLHKKWLKPIDNPILINYIIDIETLTTEMYT